MVIETIDRYIKFRERWRKQRPKAVSTAEEVMKALKEDDRDQCLFEISRVRDVLASDYEGQTILSWASRRGWTEIVHACLEIGSVVDSEDNLKRTPLSYAAENGHTEVVRILIKSQALPTTKDEDWRTPLSYASQNGHDCAITLLMADQRVNPETKDKRGWLPLHWAAAFGHCDAITVLLQEKIGINDLDLDGKTPFRAVKKKRRSG
ncbi:26S proteasome non-ATPase regulatory subunit 10 [Colletotrichum spaethianum]|uniref:26S proteasome non-ATPase regulatory subunit 10 n=1 Tax=Colletotrichum spaethianum TaxID=700344 RepID=A0AA37PGM9_9PEZI|nr:26S proteasome non-ATPase regulatory subunit 10 [Colletotrichum spaethianum]GKT51807.1 26S proteasome non-ATPase regulatory subunit 10 [Colletotrichum spaethianum]